VLFVLAAAAALYVVHVRYQARNIVGSPTVEFKPASVPRPTPMHSPKPGAPGTTAIAWPTFGLGPARLRSVDGVGLRPPFRRLWTWHGGALLEFPPVVADGRLFLSTFDGRFYALSTRSGRAVWRWNSHRCGWASPAISGALVIETFIGRACALDVPGADGQVVAFDRQTGVIRWQRTIGPTESSPLVANGLVYVGDWSGRVSALDVRDGATRWTYQLGGAVKGSAALAAGRIFIGAYDGHIYALQAHTGRLVWRASSQPRLGSRGSFYSTPSVQYDRVYIGSTDGKVYSFGGETGRLRWSHSTGGYVYASPAVWRQLILVGSYDHLFYAFDAATGAVRWTFRANGRISGAASVLDGVVYFSTFAHRTYAVSATTGRLLWTWPDGEYSPVVTDGRRIYLTGRGRIYALTTAR
jgi:outer membrane protein assembly factor BamB